MIMINIYTTHIFEQVYKTSQINRVKDLCQKLSMGFNKIDIKRKICIYISKQKKTKHKELISILSGAKRDMVMCRNRSWGEGTQAIWFAGPWVLCFVFPFC